MEIRDSRNDARVAALRRWLDGHDDALDEWLCGRVRPIRRTERRLLRAWGDSLIRSAPVRECTVALSSSRPDSLRERVCIVTGANSGIGKEVARGLACLGATVVLACRNLQRAEAARSEIAATTGNADLEVRELDLARFASVRAFARNFLAVHPNVHVLVNNAGIYAAKRVLTEDGVESTFASNHLGHFLLTNLLLDALRANAPSRIVNVASEASAVGKVHFDDLMLERRWNGLAAYSQSKLANVLFTFELARRLRGSGVTANAMHPGGVRTNWSKGSGAMRFGMLLAWPFLLPPEKGADTALWLAASPEADGLTGQYFQKRRPIDPNPIARDPAVARRLWDASETLTGLRTTAPPALPS